MARAGLRKTENSHVSTYSEICGLLLLQKLGLDMSQYVWVIKGGSHARIWWVRRECPAIPLPTWCILFIHSLAHAEPTHPDLNPHVPSSH